MRGNTTSYSLVHLPLEKDLLDYVGTPPSLLVDNVLLLGFVLLCLSAAAVAFAVPVVLLPFTFFLLLMREPAARASPTAYKPCKHLM